MRNFSSTVAITIALHSTEIVNLKATRKALKRTMEGKLLALYNIINPDRRHRCYWEALRDAATPEERDICIPWLAFHLKELKEVLHQNPPIIEVDGRRLINFKRYIRFMDCIKEVVYFSPPNLEEQRHGGQLEDLLAKLRSVDISEAPKD